MSFTHRTLLILSFVCCLIVVNESTAQYSNDDCDGCSFLEVETVGRFTIPFGYTPYLSEYLTGSYQFRRRDPKKNIIDGYLYIGLNDVSVIVEEYISEMNLIEQLNSNVRVVEIVGSIKNVHYIKYITNNSALSLKTYSCIFHSSEFYIHFDGDDEAICEDIMEQIEELNEE